MSIWGKMLNLFDYGGREDIIQTVGRLDGDFNPVSYLLDDADSFSRACISLLVKQLKIMPIQVVYRSGTNRLRPPPIDSDGAGAMFNRLLDGVIDGGTDIDFMARIANDLYSHGNCFLYPIFVRRYTEEGMVRVLRDIEVLAFEKVRKRRDSVGRIIYQIRGGETLPADRIIHIRFSGYQDERQSSLVASPPLSGLSKVRYIARLAEAQVMEGLEQRRSPLIAIMDPSYEDVKAQKKFQAIQKASEKRSFRQYPPGSDPRVLALTAQSPDLLALRKDNRLEILRAYHIPPLMMQLVEQQRPPRGEDDRIQLLQHALMPAVVAIEHALSRMFGRNYIVKIDTTAYTRGDTAAQVNKVKAMFMPGGLALATVNEGRGIFDLPPDPDPEYDKIPVMPGNIPTEGTDDATDTDQ